jgi:putative redox protein
MSPLAADCIFQGGTTMEVTIQHLGDVKFAASARGHRVICDQPAGNGGSDGGMTPPEYLLVSLGTCAGFYAVQYLKARSLPHGDLEVKVSAEKATQPARLGQFRIEVIVPGLDAQHQVGVLRAVKACLIHNTLIHAPAIETVVTTPVEAFAVQGS